MVREFDERNQRIRLSGFWAQSISGFIPKLMNGLNNLSFAIVAGIGGIMAIQDILRSASSLYLRVMQAVYETAERSREPMEYAAVCHCRGGTRIRGAG